MNNLGVIVCGSGLQDGINPCIFMTCAVFLTLGLWIRPASGRLNRVRLNFILFYVLNFLFFNFGQGQALILHKKFIFIAMLLYFILGIGSFVTGVLFLKDWVLSYRSSKPGSSFVENIRPYTGNDIAVNLISIVLGLLLSLLATIGPLNNYVLFLGTEAYLKGHWASIIPLLCGYVLTSMWPLWFVWIFLNIKGLRPSLINMFCAVIFLIASTSVIFIF